MSIFDKTKQFFAKERPALYRKVTVAPPSGNLTDAFGISEDRYHQMRDHLTPIVLRMDRENQSYSSVIDIILTDPFFKTEQEQILVLFQFARLIQHMEDENDVKGGLLGLLKRVVEDEPRMTDKELEKIKAEHPKEVEETNCGSKTCRVHGHLNKKQTKSSRPIN